MTDLQKKTELHKSMSQTSDDDSNQSRLPLGGNRPKRIVLPRAVQQVIVSLKMERAAQVKTLLLPKRLLAAFGRLQPRRV